MDFQQKPIEWMFLYKGFKLLYSKIYIYIIENICSNSILVTTDLVGLYPSIPHELGLNALKEGLDNRERKSIPTEDILKMLEFLLNKNYIEFNGKGRQQLLVSYSTQGKAIETNVYYNIHVYLWIE